MWTLPRARRTPMRDVGEYAKIRVPAEEAVYITADEDELKKFAQHYLWKSDLYTWEEVPFLL